MPASDPLYRDYERELQRRQREEQQRSPHAYALRVELVELHQRQDTSPLCAEMANLGIEVLGVVIAEGRDIDARRARELRTLYGLPQPAAGRK